MPGLPVKDMCGLGGAGGHTDLLARPLHHQQGRDLRGLRCFTAAADQSRFELLKKPSSNPACRL